MANAAKRPSSSPAPPDRRRYPRGKIDEVCYVEFPEGRNGGLILNISETGLLMQSALKITGQDVALLRFRLPGSDQWIEARAKVAWIDHSGKEAGAQFLDLPEDCRARIAEWVAKVGPPAASAAISTERSDSQETSQQSPEANIIPAPDSVRSTEARNREWLMHSFGQSTPAPKPIWRRLGRDLFWVAVGIAAVLVALRYSPKLSMLTRSIQVQSSEAGPTNAGRPSSMKALSGGDSGHPQTQSGGLVPDSSEAGAVSAAPKGSTFGKMLTQTLTSVPAAAQPSASVGGYSNDPSQSAILVGSPDAGAPPTRLILGNEPVSASSSVAITQTRSILVSESHTPTETLQLGRLVSHVSPVFPSGASAKGTDATVRVRAFIDPSGKVLRVRLLSGPAALAPVAVNAIHQWRYGQTLLDGHAIPSQADVTVYFRLH